MSKFPLIESEAERLKALQSFNILDSAEEQDFDDLTELASIICRTSVALISLVDNDRQWFKSHKGIADRETSRDLSFCAHAIVNAGEIMTVEDATKDPRFADNELVTGDPKIVFYAGIPLVTGDGFALGTLCVIDRETKKLDATQENALKILAKLVMERIEIRKQQLIQKKANDVLREDDARKNDFISMVSHELKTPLTTSKAFIQLMNQRAKAALDKDSTIIFEKLEAQITKMQIMINGFLDISRLESNQMRLDIGEFELNILLEDAVEGSRLLLDQHKIELTTCDHVFIKADRNKIEQVVENLLSNAVKYSNPASLIKVHCDVTDQLITVSVQDQGPGIQQSDLKRLFERFYRVTGNQKHSSVAGFGIGLFLCSEIITRHGGKIWAESTPGEGSTFYFTLPRVA